MHMSSTTTTNVRRTGIPRGIKSDGWPILSYGFRPFFLGAGTWAVVAMALWLGHLILGWRLGGDYGAANWHAHELLFGYATAALAGFMLTAVPNWTGRLPVSGGPLLVLVCLWLAGRVAMLSMDLIGELPAVVIEAAFLPLLGTIAAREVGAGHNWRNLHIVFGVGLLTLANILFHLAAIAHQDPGFAYRFSISVWLMLIMLIGGRLAVSFTHNWLVRNGIAALPKSFGLYDRITIVLTLLALTSWSLWPDVPLIAFPLAAASMLQTIRVLRWKGWLAWREPLVWVLHTSYLFIPIGLLSLAASDMDWITSVAALHTLTAGAIANMTLSVMTRVTRGHTGRALTASLPTLIAYLALIGAAVSRPLADLIPDHYAILISASGLLWFMAFALFLVEHAPMLIFMRRQRTET